MRAGRLDEALREAETARRLDPVTLPSLVSLAWVRHYRREFLAAIEVCKQAVELNPAYPHSHVLLALNYAMLGQQAGALASTDAATKLTRDRTVALRNRAWVFSHLPAIQDEARRVAAANSNPSARTRQRVSSRLSTLA
jgi:tetratricopeptide (TPR) repeat protein